MTTETIISVVLGIAGIIATYFFTKLQMKKNRIDHYYINSFDIGKGLTDMFPEFQLHFGDEVLSNNVKVLQGGFMNTGRNDIGENGKQTLFSLILPEGCCVKAIKQSPLVNGLVVSSGIDENEKNKIVFSIDGLFKPDECFDYSAIIETPDGIGGLYDQIKLDHRIKNTMIQNLYLGRLYYKQSKASKAYTVFSVVFVLLFIVWMVLTILNPEYQHVFSFSFGGLSFNATGLIFIVFGICTNYLFIVWGKRGRLINKLKHIRNKQVV